MVEAVAKVKSDYPPLVLAVEQDFEGSRGYGFLDYIILYHDLAIVVTEAKMTEMRKGIVQNIVQLHTAAEVSCPFCSLLAPAYRLQMLET